MGPTISKHCATTYYVAALCSPLQRCYVGRPKSVIVGANHCNKRLWGEELTGYFRWGWFGVMLRVSQRRPEICRSAYCSLDR
jgi:hypothetical protein